MRFEVEIPDDNLKELMDYADENMYLEDYTPETVINDLFFLADTTGELDLRRHVTVTKIEE